jgi:hypothetical protein
MNFATHKRRLAILPVFGVLVFGCGDETVPAGQADATSSTDARAVRERDVRASDLGGTDDPSNGEVETTDASSDPEVAESSDATDDTVEHLPDITVADSTPPRGDVPCTVDNEAEGFYDGLWDGRVWGSNPLVGGDFDLDVDGTMSFEIFCQYDKLLIEGEMSGIAEGSYPFRSDLVGEFDEATHDIEMDMVNASVMIVIIEVLFEAGLTGHLDGDTFVDGVWEGVSTSPTGAYGAGSWTAVRR